MKHGSGIVSGVGPDADNFLATQAQTKFGEGLVLHRKGHLEQAQQAYEQVLGIEPNHFEALHLLGVIAAQSRNFTQAVDSINKSIGINPNNATAYANLGNALKELGQHQAAVESYDKSIAIKPDYANAHTARAQALFALKRYADALGSYDRAIAIIPSSAENYFNRGIALYKLKQYQAAIESYDSAISLRPEIAEIYANRGLALNALKQYQAAVNSYNQAIAIKPESSEAYSNRGNALSALKQYQAAIDSYDRAIAILPDLQATHGMRLHAKFQNCDWRDEKEQLTALLKTIQHNAMASPPFVVLFLTTSLLLQRKTAEILVREEHPANTELGSFPKRSPRAKVRLAYFSMDFRNHPVATLTAELFEAHDRDRFEVFGFSFGPDTKDELRIRLESAFDKFIDVCDKSDREITELARQMEIDIAIDLSGFTGDSRTGIFALRAAPIQVNYLGYPGTMGAQYMDYLIADKTLIPEESQQHYAEKIAYLPDTYMANDSKRSISDREFTREELGLPESGFVFCCFNNNYKITPSNFDGWMRILKQVDGSVLWLTENNPTAASNLRKEAQSRGVDAQRLVFTKKLPLIADHLARHRAADLFIDTLPFNAHTTASDALWAGLPVLTCTGEAFASRVAASLLNAIGLPELITGTQEQYEALAVELATDADKLKAIRQKLQENRLSQPLFDTRRFTRNIENAYTQMVERYQADLAPEHIYVKESQPTDSHVSQ